MLSLQQPRNRYTLRRNSNILPKLNELVELGSHRETGSGEGGDDKGEGGQDKPRPRVAEVVNLRELSTGHCFDMSF